MSRTQNIGQNFRRTANLDGGSLPLYKELPEIELYMDQVISLMENYLAPFSPLWENKIVTRSMINNYVKLHIMPAPVNKRYSREHLAYLIMICILKQTLPIRSIVALINLGLKQNSIEELYNSFAKSYFEVLTNAVNGAVNRLDTDGETSEVFTDIIINMAVNSVSGRFLCESAIKQDGKIDTELLGDFALVEKDPGKVKKKKKIPLMRKK